MALTRNTRTDHQTFSSADAAPEVDPLRNWVPDELEPGSKVATVSPDSELGLLAERFAYETYREQGYCDHSDRHMIEEVEPWRDGSLLHVVCTTDETEVLGVVRTVAGEYGDLPVSQFRRVMDLPAGTILLDGGSLAVAPGYRGFGIATELYRQWVQYGIRNRVDGFCLLMDDPFVEILREFYTFETHVLAERQDYMGGSIEPVVVWMKEILESLVRNRPALYRYAIEGFTPEEIVEYDLPILLT